MQTGLHRCAGHFTRAARSARKNGRLHGSKRLCTRAHRTACIHAGLHANIPECTQASETACVHAPLHASKRGLHASTRFCTQAGAIARKHSRLQACRSRRAHARCGARCLRHLPAAIARLPAGAGPNRPSERVVPMLFFFLVDKLLMRAILVAVCWNN